MVAKAGLNYFLQMPLFPEPGLCAPGTTVAFNE